MNKAQAKLQRVAEVNAVVKAISNHGRRFFYSRKYNRVSEFQIGNQGQILYYDHYTWWPVYVAYKGDWYGFTNGGTLRELVKSFREYIRTGQKLHPFLIGLPRADGSYIWGYTRDEIAAVNAGIKGSPVFQIIEGEGGEDEDF